MKVLVGVATYNEVENIGPLMTEIRKNLPTAHIVVVDDGSPDQTARVVTDYAQRDGGVFLVQRGAKLGLGTAHRALWKYAIDRDYDLLVTMDADFSHNPQYLPTMLEKLQSYQFVTGSRYAPGGACDYGLLRQALSRTANWLARTLLGLSLRECTTSYRGFHKGLLKSLVAGRIESDGYSFFFESIYRIQKITDSMAEFPIHFIDRTAGQSKVSLKEVFRSMKALLALTWQRVAKR